MAGDSSYTALVGVAGEGEQDSPRQPQAEALFQLLLERGAEPFDIQVLYNTHFSGDMIWWLELVYAHTVTQGRKAAWDDPNWSMLDMGGYGPGAYFILNAAVAKQRPQARRVGPVSTAPARTPARRRIPKFKPRLTLYEQAVLEGPDRDGGAAGAPRRGSDDARARSDEEAFVVACLRMDRDAVRAQLEQHPEYLQSHEGDLSPRRGAIVADVVAFLLDLGVPLEIEDASKQRALHEAAGHNALRVAQLLIERGAEIDPDRDRLERDADRLCRLRRPDRDGRLPEPVLEERLDARVPRLRRPPARGAAGRAGARHGSSTNDGFTPLWWLPDDEAKAMEIVEAVHGARRGSVARSKEGRTAADWARKRGMLEVARMLAVDEAVSRVRGHATP